jgi:hypothetical protein
MKFDVVYSSMRLLNLSIIRLSANSLRIYHFIYHLSFRFSFPTLLKEWELQFTECGFQLMKLRPEIRHLSLILDGQSCERTGDTFSEDVPKFTELPRG